MSEVSWLRPGQSCFKEGEPDKCPRQQQQKQWLSQLESNPAYTGLRQAQALFDDGEPEAAEAEVQRTLSIIFGE
jgi:hypothetical protein